ncbi:hypothetical protein LOD99_4829 [Oopsacas minuta]|uniref:Transcription initiation factor TFIID subunit 2 n=1 Tax=Oopsacas minuta TaxID=111878 RepID=A0AAV7JU86_9METZ|nr:hypothetical protein LOD99_4829 [Oopsacas minuta]
MRRQRSSLSDPVVCTRGFKLISQIINITDIDFRKRSISLNTQLSFIPQNPSKPTRLFLNCQQICILKLLVNGNEAKFTYIDPSLEICYNNKNRRDANYFFQSNRENVLSSDLDLPNGVGELIVSIPQSEIHSSEIIKLNIECKLDKPKGGIQFVLPPESHFSDNQTLPQGSHLYTSTHGNTSRLWFPCVDCYSELCTWEINICCPSACFALSTGDLIDHKFMVETKRKFFKYKLNIPTSAPNIGLAVGTFEVYPDPAYSQATYFYLQGLFPIVEHTVSFLKRVYDYLQDLLNLSLPYQIHKIVFVSDCTFNCLSYSSLTICDVNLLHPREIIEQAIESRKVFIQAITAQYFGCFLCPATWDDFWIVHGIKGYASGLIFKSVFGTNEYNYFIKEMIESVVDFYSQPGASTFPLYSCSGPLPTFAPTSTHPTKSYNTTDKGHSLTYMENLFHPLLSTYEELYIFQNKAALVIRMLSLRIGKDILLKVLQKILALCSQASKCPNSSEWTMMLVSTVGFLRLILTVSGKDISSFMHNWVCSSGIPSLSISYSFNRRKNSLEMEVKQDSNSNIKSKFTGPLAIVVQEIDTFYLHTIQIEDVISRHEIQFHTKLKRTKRKQKCILFNGLEIEVDLTSSELEYPLLWVKPDPQMCWMSKISIDQPTLMWMNQLKHERDVISQRDAINTLTRVYAKEVISHLVEMLLDTSVFYRVRIQCIKCLIQLLNKFYYDENPISMLDCFYKLYGSKETPSIIAPNDFSNFGHYLLQKEMPKTIAGLRNQQQQTPRDVLKFLIDLLKYNENASNDYSDDYYVASLVDAMRSSLTVPLSYFSSKSALLSPQQHFSTLSKEIIEIIRAVIHLLNTEKLLPSYQYVITCSCITTIRLFQTYGFIPMNLDFFYTYINGQYSHVQFVALIAIIDILSSIQDYQMFSDFLNYILNHDCISFRCKAIQLLISTPPFVKKRASKLNKPDLVERLWTSLNFFTAFNPQERILLANLYLVMYGRVTPACLPQSLGVVIDLKEKTAHCSLHPD